MRLHPTDLSEFDTTQRSVFSFANEIWSLVSRDEVESFAGYIFVGPSKVKEVLLLYHLFAKLLIVQDVVHTGIVRRDRSSRDSHHFQSPLFPSSAETESGNGVRQFMATPAANGRQVRGERLPRERDVISRLIRRFLGRRAK